MNTDPKKPTDVITRNARASANRMSTAGTAAKNDSLALMAQLLQENRQRLTEANKQDMKDAERNAVSQSLIDRLLFDDAKIESRIRCLEKIARLPDPVGQVKELKKTENGLLAGRMRVPLGVILMIYEARPHVTVNAGAFAIKSGNAIVCKGGSEAAGCNAILGELWQEALDSAGLPTDAVQVVSLSHREVDELLQSTGSIDLVIPRGGKKLIEKVAQRSKIPVIKHYEGVCNIYIGREADRKKALDIVLDSKLMMPAVCNAAETVLLDAGASDWAPELAAALMQHGIEVRGCKEMLRLSPQVKPAVEDDWRTEYLDKIYSLRIVDGLEEAMQHIGKYGSGHTDVIVTENYSEAQRFVAEVDSSVVLVNASTMFCDGESLGMGAEIGISTDRLHARGPMGLEELTTYKHVIWGQGQVYGDGGSW